MRTNYTKYIWIAVAVLIVINMVSSITSGGLMSLILSIPALLLSLSVHEFAHGYAAYKMGDNTARYEGRLTLNPMAHLDPIGTFCLLFFHFGWANPVPINPLYFKNKRKGIIIVSLAGPFANFCLAVICTVIYALIIKFAPQNMGILYEFLLNIFNAGIILNIGLMIFNHIPIPPLEGSKILGELLPAKARFEYYRIERTLSLILIFALVFGLLDPILDPLYGVMIKLMNYIIGIIL